jgi:hypothetical protein
LDVSILLPESCVLTNGIVTATGNFRDGQVPEIYQRSGAVVELYVYTRPSTENLGGNNIASLLDEHPYPMIGSGPWIVTTPLYADWDPTGATCVVAVQPTHKSVPVVSAPRSVATIATGIQRLPISVSTDDPGASILIPASCILQNGMVTAIGTLKDGYAPGSYTRGGAVVELYVYSSASPGKGTQLADLSQEHPDFIAMGPWTVTVPIDTRLGRPASCQVDVESTHEFQSAPF